MDESLRYLIDKFRERRTELVEHMAQGALIDHGEYKKLCGTIQGLEFAELTIKDLATRLEKQDE